MLRQDMRSAHPGEPDQAAASDQARASSAKLTRAPDASLSVLRAVDAVGSVYRLTALGQRTDHPLPSGWQGLQVGVSGRCTVWATGLSRDGVYGVFGIADASGGWK